MNLFELKQKLKNNELDKFYVFYGEEYIVLETYVDKIVKASGLSRKSLYSVTDISSSLRANNIFGSSYVYVIREDRNFMVNPNLWDIVKNNNSKHILIFIYSNIDKRSKFYSSNEDYIVEFIKLSPEVILKHIMNDYQISSEYGIKIINRCDNDYGKILLNLKKLKILATINNTTINEIYPEAIKENLIPISNTDILSDFSECILDADINNVWLFLKLLRNNNEASIKLLGIIYNNLRSLMLVQACSSKNISQKTGLDDWLAKKLLNYTNVYDISTLVKSLSFLRESEVGLKSGNIDENMVLENCLVNIYFEHFFG